MSAGTITTGRSSVAQVTGVNIDGAVWSVLRVLGSLRITVWGFALAILILFVGTLAQDEETIVDVKKLYFNSWIANVPLDVLKPITIWPTNEYPRIPGSIFLPGGALIGLVLLINLIAAKLTRFHMTAKGGKLISGLAFCLVGATITAVVILGAHAEDGLQGEPPFSYETLWQICRWTIFASTLGMGIWWSVRKFQTMLGQILTLVVIAALVIWSLAILLYPEMLRIPDPGLRIVWQMSKSLIAGGILLVGLNLLFGKRGGNVLIHLSIGLLMLGQFIFGDRQIEERMMIADGEKTMMAIRPDEVELVVIDPSSNEVDKVVAIDERQVRRMANNQSTLEHPSLPFKVRVKKFMENTDFVMAKESTDTNLATQGVGLRLIAKPAQKFGGAIEKRQNFASGYIEVVDSKTNASIGVFLLTRLFNDRRVQMMGTEEDSLEEVSVDGKTYLLGLRARRTYKNYEILLKDGVRIDYTGTSMARDFSSWVNVTRKDKSSSLDGRIWMNNPMRFEGETFYQAEFVEKGTPLMRGGPFLEKDTTVLQVVTNAGWLMPYIACAFAALGMLGHFGTTFARFASRFDRERLMTGGSNSLSSNTSSKGRKDEASGKDPSSKSSFESSIWRDAALARQGTSGWLLPLVVVLLVGGMFGYYAKTPQVKEGQLDWYSAGTLPVQHEGRIKPFDSVARDTLIALSGRTSTVIRAEDLKKEADVNYSATQWLLTLISGDDSVSNAKVFRIDAKEVLDFFGLTVEDSGGTIKGGSLFSRHNGRNRYSWNQLAPKLDEFFSKTKELRSRAEENKDALKFVDQKFMDLNSKLNIYQLVRFSYGTSIPPMPEDMKDEAAVRAFREQLQGEFEAVQSLEAGNPPGMLPPTGKLASNDKADSESAKWRALRPTMFRLFMAKALGIGEDLDTKSLMPLISLLDAARDQEASKFNTALAEFRRTLEANPNSEAVMPKANFEAWYNKFSAVNGCIAFYLMASVFAFLSLIVVPQGFRRIAFWITLVVFVVHVIAIIGRVYITGRAPVINLYSSAVYIGCGAVFFGLVLEWLFPIRIGLLVGSVIGATSLLVAYGLEVTSGDTMPVLQAVLDTQFWLTTHVQCITAGYLATFVAGGIAIAAIIHRVLAAKNLRDAGAENDAKVIQRLLFRITYGVICFAIFFSLIGTVLGGLWADDSWGRFWGWDPKENGALMIVLWNAIVLHARWDKLVRERGFALLCIGGNIITAWSWFGTNQLGIGLHSYGFTSSVLQLLAGFVVVHLVIILLGWLLTVSEKHPGPKSEPMGSWE